MFTHERSLVNFHITIFLIKPNYSIHLFTTSIQLIWCWNYTSPKATTTIFSSQHFTTFIIKLNILVDNVDIDITLHFWVPIYIYIKIRGCKAHPCWQPSQIIIWTINLWSFYIVTF